MQGSDFYFVPFNFALNSLTEIQILKVSNPGGQSKDNEIIKWIKDRMTHEVYGMDYVEEYPYDVILSYPIGENKVRIFRQIFASVACKNQSF